MATINRTSPVDPGTPRRTDIYTLPVWVPYAGIESGTSTAKTLELVHCILTAQGLDDAALEYINEETVNSLGTMPKTVNNGQRIADFNLTLRGNDIGNLFALVGLNFNDVAAPALYKDHGVLGALAILSFSPETGDIKRTDIILNVAVKVNSMPGGSVGSSTDQTITFYSDSAKLYTLPPTLGVGFEIWYDDGTGTDIVNVNAPDGILTDFDLGTGNGSYSGTVNPAAVAIEANASLTGYKQNFFLVMVDGVEQDPAQLTYSTMVTNHLEFGTAPADGSVIFAAYTYAQGLYDMPNYRSDLGNSGGLRAQWSEVLQPT